MYIYIYICICTTNKTEKKQKQRACKTLQIAAAVDGLRGADL